MNIVDCIPQGRENAVTRAELCKRIGLPDRTVRELSLIHIYEILQIANEEGKMEAKCQYCGRMYEIGKSELEELAASAQKENNEEM